MGRGACWGVDAKLLEDIVRKIVKPLRALFGKLPDVQHHTPLAAEVLEEVAKVAHVHDAPSRTTAVFFAVIIRLVRIALVALRIFFARPLNER